MDARAPEAQEVRKYLKWLTSFPWGKKSAAPVDLAAARKILDEDHFGLDKIKERIIEYLAVQKRVGTSQAPILCFVGPPGVGKTSLAKSIARATGRKFERIALGGIRDEGAIRGHTRVYVGSRPGKIMQAMKRAGTSDPLILLDEVDKVHGGGHQGDPEAALLEVLDPEQNTAFTDHYVEVGYDLSNVVFVATANSLSNIQRPLLDRMEVINLPAYTENEKLQIAKSYLVKKQRKLNGLQDNEFSISDESLRVIIRQYTMEAGVRNLDRVIAKACRKATTQILSKQKKRVAVTKSNLEEYAGAPLLPADKPDVEPLVGVTTGLSWSEIGGGTLKIEAVVMPGSGQTVSTGLLGNVMQESVKAAISYIRSHAGQYGIAKDLFKDSDIHVHFPDGGTPKDGPSAGIATVTSIVSALTGNPVRHDLAMTGEVTLNGQVLPIGGLREKLLAARQHGIKTVLIPKENEFNLKEIPNEAKQGLRIIPVQTVDEVLKYALKNKAAPIPAVVAS